MCHDGYAPLGAIVLPPWQAKVNSHHTSPIHLPALAENYIGVQDIVLSRRFNPQAGALLGGPPGSAAANATVRRLRGMMEEHGVRQLTGGARHAYAPLIDRGR